MFRFQLFPNCCIPGGLTLSVLNATSEIPFVLLLTVGVLLYLTPTLHCRMSVLINTIKSVKMLKLLLPYSGVLCVGGGSTEVPVVVAWSLHPHTALPNVSTIILKF
jgi:hypothetical protein